MANPQDKTDLQQAISASRQAFLFILLFSLFINLLMLAPSIYMLQVYDRVITTRSPETLLMLTLVVVFLFVVMGALDLVRSRILVRVGNRLDMQINERLYQATFKRALLVPGRPSAQPFNDLTTLRQFLSGNGLFAFFDAPWIPVYIAILTLFHPWFGIFAAVAASVLLALAWINEKSTQSLLSEANREHIQSQDLAQSNLRNAEVLQAMGMLPNLLARWRGKHHDYLLHQSHASDRAGTLSNVSKTLRILFQSLILGLGAFLVIEGSLTGGMMIAGSILMGRALAPIDQMIGGWKGFIAARTAHGRLNALLSAVPAEPQRMPLPPPTGRLALESVTAGPPGESRPTLWELDLLCNPGEHIAIVGPSAAGKSTLARVMLGVWPVQSGCVRIGGTDIGQWPRERLGPFIGYLPQDVELFDGSISENIARFGDLDPARVIEAAQKAGVHDIILRQPSGYDTQISGAGGILSGGQRQRLGLARALYGNPVLVVLDEPDANLDASGERALLHCLRQLKTQGTTVFIISHSSTILEHVDRVLTLQEGRMVSCAPARQPAPKMAQSSRESGTPVHSIRMRARGKPDDSRSSLPLPPEPPTS
ncbi:type I secretion system permease/ATPase [Salinicola sp. LHM]|uniref:type I secretion system permease/ATPase n=1 Tax=Salinicola sp. LHM TaxID=3065298 RepID=UPI002ACE87CC|nr:type I secretion system permease/ATPase [Salinicola sp. LHM]MEC8917997.1 type I secretion system permease/ATPase [Pseudomonadota bacterium]MED5501859.1 type I secretion system permease/ATPase [Pseudomonadota bacterium]WQH34690.1 type I secretion system permease/ATPase [Salinicola sp. LHM]